MKEYLYHKIRPRLLVEPFVGDPPTFPIDYKFFVFGGRVEFVQVHIDRGSPLHREVIYDPQWRRQPYTFRLPLAERDVPPPSSLANMIDAAEKLAEGFSFVCVDLYEIGGKPLFGEMTFLSGSGFNRMSPPEFDIILGAKWPAD